MKRALSLILALILIIGVIPVSAYAEDTATPTITMTTDASQPLKIGDTFTVTAALSDNPGFASITLTLLWNSNVVKFTGFSTEYNELVDADLLKDTIIAGVPTINPTDGIITAGAKKDNNKNGTLFIANFEVIGYGNCDIKLDRTDVTKFVLANVNKDQFSVNYVDTTVAPLAVSKIADPSNPQFEVYYQIDGTDKDDDNFYEVDPGATVDVGVYVKADSAQTMQAFDIYPKWDAPLTYSDVVGETGVTVVKTEMSKANPHFTTNLTDATAAATNKQITTAGVKIATLKLTLDEPAVHSQQYKIYFSDAFATNLAREKDAESVNVTYDTKGVMGVETLRIYKVSYDDGVSEPDAPVSVPNNQEKQHGVQLALSATKPMREGYTFAGWLGSDEVTYEPGDEYNTNANLVLTAQWTRDQVTVTFNMNDHGTQVPQQTIDPGTKATKPTDPTETGWKFIGWYSNEALTNAFDFDTPINANTTIYAKWEIEKYDVTFNMNGKGGDNTTVPVEHGEKVTAREVSNITGYTFDGWYTEADCENKFDFNTPITEPKTLYAKWTPVEVTVTLNVNGGDELTDDTITVTFGEKYTDLPTELKKTGYTFDGWYDDSNNKVTTETVVTNAAAHELTAKWNVNTYTVKFNPGTGGTGTPYTQEFKYDVTDKLTPNAFTASEEGYSFAGWATEAGGEVVYKNGQAVSKLATSGEVNLYAVWKQNTINYVSDPTGVKMNLELLPDSYTLGEKLEITAKPTAEGYTFNGWSNEALSINTKNDPNAFIIIPDTATGNIELTAHWTINQYTITFDSVEGSAVDPITKDYGTEIAKPTDPTKTGYTFKGWYEDADYNTAVEFPYILKDDVTLYAKWEINKYTVTFNANGHGTAPAEQTVEYDATAMEPTPAPTEPGYTFGGWYTEADCENKFNFATKIVDAVTLYAKWTENTYTIKYGGDASEEESKTVSYTEDVTLPTITKPGYDLVGWTDEETGTTAKYTEEIVSGLVTENGGSITLYPIWTEAEYIVTFAWGDHAADPDAKVPDAIKVTYNDKYPTLPADVAPANGYKFDGWYIGETKIQTDDTVKITTGAEAVAKYSKIKYTITFDPKDGVVSPETMDYYVSTTNLTLPTPTWENHTFVKWVVKAGEGSWHKDSKFEITTAGNWGNVEVYAQWESSVTTVVEDYKYAMDGYVMLRIPTDANANAYTFNGVKMFYTDDGEYKIDGKAVFVTLIPENNGQEGGALVSYVANGKLTDAGLALLKQGSEEATVIDRTSGRINMNDEIVNIADANAVYQMVEFGGGYYRETQLSIEKRLMADMFTEYTEGDARGTLQDVNEIVKLINAAANATTNP